MINLNSATARFEKWLLPLIVLITAAVFLPVVWHDFIPFDDNVFVYENEAIASGLTLEGVRWAFTTFHEGNWIPLSWLSHMLDVQLFGLNPGGHHLVNVLFHTANSALLFIFFKRATGAAWQSVAVALLFAIHPLHVESVAWVAERKDVLSSFFGMLTIYSYLLYAEKSAVSNYLTTLLLFLLALLSKSMLVTLPALLLLLDWWPLKRFAHSSGCGSVSSRRMRHLLLEKVPFFLLSAGVSVTTYLAHQTVGILEQSYTVWSRVGKIFIYYVTYLYKMLFPFDLGVLYPFPKYPPGALQMFLAALFLITATGIVVLLSKRFPFLLTGWLWYLTTLLPVIGIIQIGQHTIADRYTYISLIGIFIMLAWGIPEILGGLQSLTTILASLFALSLAGMILLTTLQLKHWQNGMTIFSHTVAVTKDNWVALNNLGLIYLEQGKTDEAVRYLKKAIAAKPSLVMAHINLGNAYYVSKDYDRAIESYSHALQFERLNPQALVSLARVYLLRGERTKSLEIYEVLKGKESPFAPALLEMINSAAAGKQK